MYTKIIEYLENKNISIVGYGKEGKSTYNFIRKYLPNQKLTIIDNNDKLIENNPELREDENLDFVLGIDALNNLKIYDVIIKAPGVKFKDLDISEFKDKITSELDLALRFFKNNIIGITGTKGKSTTTSLIYKVFKEQNYDAYLLGNIGIPIFDYIDQINEKSKLIIEMGAPQLEFITASPHISIVLNLFEEHLDYFGTKDKYFLSKMNAFKYQNENDYGFYLGSNETLNNYILKGNYKSKLYNISDMKIDNDFITLNNKKLYNINDERLLLGKHNLSNIMFVLYLSEVLGLDLNKTIKTINTFEGLEHRMEYVGIFNGIKFYNDAIATIPDACINACETLNPDTLIFGGMDRGIDYSDLIEYFNKSKISNFICMPDTGYKISDKLKNKNVYKIENLKDAVAKAKEVTKKICVMSPAAPSYNAFKNFEEKGTLYKKYIKEG